MLFFIDAQQMKTHGSLQRFCFALAKHAEIEDGILKNATEKRILADLGIKNFQVFCDGSFRFFILDIPQTVDLKRWKNKQHNQEKTPWELLGLERAVLLERIFRKEPQENRLPTELDSYNRTVMTLALRNDTALLEEYKQAHTAVWPKIIDNMTLMGIKAMEIYLLGYQAFLIMDTAQDFDLETEGARWANLPQEKEWQQYVSKFQRVDPRSTAVEKWKRMKLFVIQ